VKGVQIKDQVLLKEEIVTKCNNRVESFRNLLENY
jgi:hypothetical protein